MHELTAFVSNLNSVLWGPFCLIPLLVGTGIYFSFKLRFVQVRRFGRAASYVLRHVKFFGNKADGTGMSSFQSLATAIAAQVGTGNLAGVATALAMGGPGAIFWMWIAAFFGMATIFVEAVLAQHFKTKDANGHVTGGPAYYITNGLHCKPLAMFFSVAIIIALGFIGNMVQANSIALAFDFAFGIPPWVVGVVVALIAAFIFIGGIRRIASTTEKIVPFCQHPGTAPGVDVAQKIVKLAVFERHHRSGHVGLGFLGNYGLQCGAVASSIAHDSHNLIVAGANDADMVLAGNTVRKNKGGLAFALNGQVVGELPLPVAGLMSTESAESVEEKLQALKAALKAHGISEDIDAFMTLAFVSLPVIPKLRLNTYGIVDVDAQRIVPAVF